MIDNITKYIEQREKFIIRILLLISLVTLTFGLSALLNPRVEIQWKTETEVDTLGYHIYRKNLKGGEDFTKITPEIILAEGSSVNSASYTFTDFDVKSGNSYAYQLSEILLNHDSLVIDELKIMVQYQGLLEIGISIFLVIFAVMWSKKK